MSFTRELIEERSIPEPNSGCWIWLGVAPGGYGRLRSRGKFFRAHRVSYELFKGEDPGDLFVCHACDNPSCVNPDHLFLGTCHDNINDMLRKGRHRAGITSKQDHFSLGRAPRGEECHTAKISEADAKAVIRMAAEGTSTKAIAERFGLKRDSVRCIIRGKAWKHLERPPRSLIAARRRRELIGKFRKDAAHG